MLGATLLAAALATFLALLCVHWHGRRMDRAVLGFAAALHSVPSLVLSVVLWDALCDGPGIFPYEGYSPLLEDPARWAWHLTLPWIAVALPFAGAYVPVLRAGMLEARSADWVRAARGKGLRERTVVWRHMFRSSLAAPVSILGLDLSHAFGGYVLYVETIFRVPGVGALAESGVSGLDLPAVVAMTVWLAITVVVVSALLDVVVRALDPRVTAGAWSITAKTSSTASAKRTATTCWISTMGAPSRASPPRPAQANMKRRSDLGVAPRRTLAAR